MKLKYTHQLFSQKIINLSSPCKQVSTRIGGRLQKLSVLLLYFGKSKWECATHHPPKMQTVFRSGLSIEIVFLWGNSAHSNITESLLGRSGVGSFPGLSNQCKFWLAIQQAGSYAPDTSQKKHTISHHISNKSAQG